MCPQIRVSGLASRAPNLRRASLPSGAPASSVLRGTWDFLMVAGGRAWPSPNFFGWSELPVLPGSRKSAPTPQLTRAKALPLGLSQAQQGESWARTLSPLEALKSLVRPRSWKLRFLIPMLGNLWFKNAWGGPVDQVRMEIMVQGPAS